MGAHGRALTCGEQPMAGLAQDGGISSNSGDFSRFGRISRGWKYVERVIHMDLKYILMP